jgi:hypothetical protein
MIPPLLLGAANVSGQIHIVRPFCSGDVILIRAGLHLTAEPEFIDISKTTIGT